MVRSVRAYSIVNIYKQSWLMTGSIYEQKSTGSLVVIKYVKTLDGQTFPLFVLLKAVTRPECPRC